LGTYSLSGIPAGQYRIIYSKTGYAPQKQIITIVSSGATSNKSDNENYQVVNDEQLLPLTGNVDGSVVDQNGVPVKNAVVTATITFNGVMLDTVFTAVTSSSTNPGLLFLHNFALCAKCNCKFICNRNYSFGVNSVTYNTASALNTKSVNIQINENQIQLATANFITIPGTMVSTPRVIPSLHLLQM